MRRLRSINPSALKSKRGFGCAPGHDRAAERRSPSPAAIDPNYYLDAPPDPGEKGLIAARQTLARLLELPVPADNGLYPALSDLYHELLVGPVLPDQAVAWDDHPWLCAVFVIEPAWDCDLDTWRAEFAGAVPTAPFAVAPTDAGGDVLPADVRVEQAGGGWVVRGEDGLCWCNLVENSWADASDEDAEVLTFPTEAEAVAAFIQADRMYDERAARQRTALDRLDELDALGEDGADGPAA